MKEAGQVYRLGVLVSGRGTNLEALIKAQQAGKLGAEIGVVISDNPRAEALKKASSHGIDCQVIDPALYPGRIEFDRALRLALEKYRVELVVLAGFLRILSTEFLEAFPARAVNIHPSLLPAFPGLRAQQQAWEYGVKYSGCTVHFVDGELDGGPIIAQAVVPVFSEDTPESLAARILMEEHKLYPQVISWLAQGWVKIVGRKVIIDKSKDQEEEAICAKDGL
ncbi:MAG TPA: phosphoribosylglycinamide formyltransferase [Clostridia bacterium]|nr:phosphoribosylglycinamide formyltransferase [Clostridia bacterium]